MALPPRWRVAESVRQLHSQLRPLAPDAPASSFGTVADSAHGTSSDHYPKVHSGLGSIPVVTAGDFPLAGRLDPHVVLEGIRLSRDSRVKYGISRGRMFSSYPASGYPAWAWRRYTGRDGHFSHGHLSVVGDARADDTRPWVIAVSSPPNTGADMGPLFVKFVDNPTVFLTNLITHRTVSAREFSHLRAVVAGFGGSATVWEWTEDARDSIGINVDPPDGAVEPAVTAEQLADLGVEVVAGIPFLQTLQELRDVGSGTFDGR